MSRYPFEERDIDAKMRLRDDLKQVDSSLDQIERIKEANKKAQAAQAGSLVNPDSRRSDGLTDLEAVAQARQVVAEPKNKIEASLNNGSINRAGNGTTLSKN